MLFIKNVVGPELAASYNILFFKCYVMLCYVMLCYVMLCYVMLCCVVLCYVMLCYVMLCYVMLCCVMLCYVMLYEGNLRISINFEEPLISSKPVKQ